MKSCLRILAMLILVASCAGCAALMTIRDRDLSHANDLFRHKKYTEALAGYRKALSSTPSQRDATARYAIGLILAYYDNPDKNYAQALEAFSEFLKLYPDHEKAPEARNWKNTLKTLVEATRENEQLKKNIEELKRLDIRHEEKRKRR